MPGRPHTSSPSPSTVISATLTQVRASGRACWPLRDRPPARAPKPTTTAKGPKKPAISRSGLNRNTSTAGDSKAPRAGPPHQTASAEGEQHATENARPGRRCRVRQRRRRSERRRARCGDPAAATIGAEPGTGVHPLDSAALVALGRLWFVRQRHALRVGTRRADRPARRARREIRSGVERVPGGFEAAQNGAPRRRPRCGRSECEPRAGSGAGSARSRTAPASTGRTADAEAHAWKSPVPSAERIDLPRCGRCLPAELEPQSSEIEV